MSGSEIEDLDSMATQSPADGQAVIKRRTNARIHPFHKPARFRASRRGPAQRQDFHPATGIPTMSSQVRIQSHAGNVLRQLEPLPPGPPGPEHRLIVARNMALIQNVTADTIAERTAAERRRKEIEGRTKRALRLTHPAYQPAFESDDDDDIITPGSGGGGGGGRGSNKRSRPDGDEEESKPAKRARLYANPELQIQEPVDIIKLAPLPTRINYPAHPTIDRPDLWFIDNFTQLYRQMEAICSHFYGLHDIPVTAEPWAECKMTPEFLCWAEQVAQPNPRFGSWDELLRDKQMRKWFVMAIIMKVFKVKVFDIYLFGATKEQEILMLQVDKAFLNREGFQREDVRAKQTATILGAASVTALFYPSVAKLTAQIALMLSPLTSYLYSLPPPANTPAPRIESLYQSLHNLVSHAGYLAICTKLTPSIIQIHDLRPGEEWHPDDMHSLDTDNYAESKRTISADYKEEKHALRVFAAQLAARAKSLAEAEAEAGSRGSRAYRKALAALHEAEAALAAKTQMPPTHRHRALIKIAAWPVIRRYTPGPAEEEAEAARKPLREKNGFRIMLIAKGAVVAYYGREVRAPEDHSTLEEWTRLKGVHCGNEGWKEVVGKGGSNFVRMLSCACALAVVATAGQWVDRSLGGDGGRIVEGLAESARGGVLQLVTAASG